MEKMAEAIESAIAQLKAALDRGDHEAAHVYAQVLHMLHAVFTGAA